MSPVYDSTPTGWDADAAVFACVSRTGEQKIPCKIGQDDSAMFEDRAAAQTRRPRRRYTRLSLLVR